MKENGLAPSPKKDISSPQYKKIWGGGQKYGWGEGEVYTMENKDTKTRVGDQNLRHGRNYNQNHFFV